MDVGNPSNFPRMYDLYENNFDSLSQDVISYYFNDDETRSAMRDVYHASKYVLDPHGAIGYLGLKTFMEKNSSMHGIFLETAHPGKFNEVVEETLNAKIELPERLMDFMTGRKKSIKLSSHFADFKELLPALVS